MMTLGQHSASIVLSCSSNVAMSAVRHFVHQPERFLRRHVRALIAGGGPVHRGWRAAILRDQADLLYNRTVPLDEVLPKKEIEEVQNALADAHETRQQAAAVEHFLARRISTPKESLRR